jgi:hypothetical protein
MKEVGITRRGRTMRRCWSRVSRAVGQELTILGTTQRVVTGDYLNQEWSRSCRRSIPDQLV